MLTTRKKSQAGALPEIPTNRELQTVQEKRAVLVKKSNATHEEIKHLQGERLRAGYASDRSAIDACEARILDLLDAQSKIRDLVGELTQRERELLADLTPDFRVEMEAIYVQLLEEYQAAIQAAADVQRGLAAIVRHAEQGGVRLPNCHNHPLVVIMTDVGRFLNLHED